MPLQLFLSTTANKSVVAGLRYYLAYKACDSVVEIRELRALFDQFMVGCVKADVLGVAVFFQRTRLSLAAASCSCRVRIRTVRAAISACCESASRGAFRERAPKHGQLRLLRC